MKISKVSSSSRVKDANVINKPLKKPVKACDMLVVSDCKYADAISLISAAIESLATVAKDDPIAKDSIANLGVVMLDLKGGC